MNRKFMKVFVTVLSTNPLIPCGETFFPNSPSLFNMHLLSGDRGYRANLVCVWGQDTF